MSVFLFDHIRATALIKFFSQMRRLIEVGGCLVRAALIRINTINGNIVIMKQAAMTQPFNDVLPASLMTFTHGLRLLRVYYI